MTERIVDHIGIAVHSLDDAIPVWERIVGGSASNRETVDAMGVEVAFLGGGLARIELVAPLRPDSPVARFLERRGPGLHHVCFRVADIRAALATFIADGYQPIDAEPRPGAHGTTVAFLHPRSTTGALVELTESD
jgi:methylmalonyl-CoA epimerase